MKPSRALQMATYVAASRAAAAWARRKQAEFDAAADEFHARQADLDDTPPAFYRHPLARLYAILFLLLAIGGVVTAYSLHSRIAPVPAVTAAPERATP